jgi:hypothetical protein
MHAGVDRLSVISAEISWAMVYISLRELRLRKRTKKQLHVRDLVQPQLVLDQPRKARFNPFMESRVVCAKILRAKHSRTNVPY